MAENMSEMTPYEQVKVASLMQRNHTSGTATAGLVLGSVATVAAIGAWIFAPLYANSKANGVRMLADARYDATQNTLNQIAGLLAAERNERIAGDVNITNTISDTQSGSQQGSIAAQIENSAMATATAQIMTGMMTGQYSQNPQRVTLWQDAKACNCNTGCGCGQ